MSGLVSYVYLECCTFGDNTSHLVPTVQTFNLWHSNNLNDVVIITVTTHQQRHWFSNAECYRAKWTMSYFVTYLWHVQLFKWLLVKEDKVLQIQNCCIILTMLISKYMHYFRYVFSSHELLSPGLHTANLPFLLNQWAQHWYSKIWV